jgi:hypothetical protein
MTVREFLIELQRLPRDAEVLAFEAGCKFSPGRLGSTLRRKPFVLVDAATLACRQCATGVVHSPRAVAIAVG